MNTNHEGVKDIFRSCEIFLMSISTFKLEKLIFYLRGPLSFLLSSIVAFKFFCVFEMYIHWCNVLSVEDTLLCLDPSEMIPAVLLYC